MGDTLKDGGCHKILLKDWFKAISRLDVHWCSLHYYFQNLCIKDANDENDYTPSLSLFSFFFPKCVQFIACIKSVLLVLSC